MDENVALPTLDVKESRIIESVLERLNEELVNKDKVDKEDKKEEELNINDRVVQGLLTIMAGSPLME